ncbi:MAG: hypothetical protein ACHQ49_01975 [Elusimicrobiota bacterium]
MNSGELRPAAAEAIPVWNRALGGLLFVAGLGLWVSLSLGLLPYTYHDLHYLFTVEGGAMGPVEWVHPLFVPLLGASRWVLVHCGFSGRMLMPLELANLGVGGLTLAALFLLAARLSRDAVAAAATTLWVGFSQGFWAGVLRPDPYALAAAATVATLGLLLIRRPGPDGRRYLMAGAAAGLTTALHASGLSLVPVAAVAAWTQAGATRRGAGLVGAFLASLVTVTASALLILCAYHRIGAEFFRHADFSRTFHNIEQMPQSSIYTSGRWSKQAADLLRMMHYHAGKGLLALLAALAAVAASRPRSRAAAAVGLASTASYAAFFLINNTQNGFMFAAFLSVPLLLCVVDGIPQAWRPLAGPAMITAMAISLPGAAPSAGPAGDPLFSEARFLNTLIHRGDLLVLPGCPFPELMYDRRFDALQAGDVAEPAQMCVVPVAVPELLLARLTARLLLGHRVFFSAGQHAAAAAPDAGSFGSQKSRQPFATRDVSPERQAAAVKALAQGLRSSFDMDCGLRSPQGWGYCRLQLKNGSRRRPDAGSASPRSMAKAADSGPGMEARLEGGREDFLGMRARYLLDWLAESPEDTFVREDFKRLSAECQGPGRASPVSPSRRSRKRLQNAIGF